MSSRVTRVVTLALAVGGAALLAVAATEPKHKYIGVGKCAKLCHKSAKQGNQLGLWEKTKHAEAYKVQLWPKIAHPRPKGGGEE